MTIGFANFLYGSIAVEFKSSFGLAESINRRQAVSKRSIWSAMGYFIGAAALLVALYWGRWWHAQRVHFDDSR